MTEEELQSVDVNALLIHQIVYDDEYSHVMSWRGYYGDYNDISMLDAFGSNLIQDHATGWRHLYADKICYDVSKGIIYYRAEGNYYPVQSVSLHYDGNDGSFVYHYKYDFGINAYKLNYKSAREGSIWEEEQEILQDGYAAGELQEEQEIPEEIPQDRSAAGSGTEKIERILAGENGAGGTVNFAELNDTDFNYTNWGTLLLDNIRMIDSSELTLIESDNYSDECFIKQPGYYLNENFTLVVSEELQTDNYWVVSLLPESVLDNLPNSKYAEHTLFVNLYYDVMDRNAFQVLGVMLFVMIVSFGFLVYAGGHRRGVDGIVLTWFDRIPIDVLSVCAVMAELVMLNVALSINASIYVWIWTLGIFGFLMTVTGVGYMLSLCVRVKSGKWWRNSFCYWVYSKIRDMIVCIFRNIGLLGKPFW